MNNDADLTGRCHVCNNRVERDSKRQAPSLAMCMKEVPLSTYTKPGLAAAEEASST